LDVIALENELVFLGRRQGNADTVQHAYVAYKLLAQEVPDFKFRAAILNSAVHGEMGVYKTHFVLEALRDTDDHVVNQGLNGP